MRPLASADARCLGCNGGCISTASLLDASRWLPRDSAPTVREADRAPPPDAKVKVTYRGGKKGKQGSKTVPVTSVPTSDDGATIELKAFRVPGKDQPVSIKGFAFVADGQDADGALALAAL